MSRRVGPIKNTYGTDFYADTISGADVPINSHIRPMDAKFIWGLNWSPNLMTLMFPGNLPFLLKVWVYWQTIHRVSIMEN
jgi:hypothetical protein